MVNKFAQNSEIKMLIEEKQINTSQFRRFLSSKGIFSMVKNSVELSNQVYPFFFSSSDIQYLQDLMQSYNSYEKSSIILINPREKYDTLDEFVDVISEDIQQHRLKKSKYKVEETYKDTDGNLHVRMTYDRKGKGKTELIKYKKREINIKIEKRSKENGLLLDIRQNDNTDLKEVDMFINEINGANDEGNLFNIDYITLDKLTKENRIKFFDELIKYPHSNWRLDDIKGIDFKKDEDESEEEQDELISSDDLAGINTAVFKGSSIRDSGIVKKFEEQGFFFTSMKYKYSYKKTEESFIVDINFKGTDNIKIDIVKTYEKGERDRDLISVLPASEQELIIVGFQNAAYDVYNLLVNSQKKA